MKTIFKQDRRNHARADDGAAHAFRLQTSHFRLPRVSRGFTLNELLVVMAIIILVLAIAIPAFSLITTGKSIEATENQMSAFLSAVRGDAVGMQDPRGAVIFIDPASNRVTMVEVWFPPGQRPNLDIYPGKEEMKLPAGVSFRGIPNGIPNSNMDNWPRFAIVMFDGDGRLLLDFASVVTVNTLFNRLNIVATSSPDKPPIPTVANNQTNIGVILFDKARHDEQPAANRQKWFTENAVPYLINRYNGTLMKGQ
jgi:prepilin-type N-terminal cleavage/methylation domain-containing protein